MEQQKRLRERTEKGKCTNKREKRASRGLGEPGNIGKILKGTREHKPILREQGNKTVQIRGEDIVI